MLGVLKDGGNAIDATIAGCLVQATVQQDMTNHTGTVTFLYWEASTGQDLRAERHGARSFPGSRRSGACPRARACTPPR